MSEDSSTTTPVPSQSAPVLKLHDRLKLSSSQKDLLTASLAKLDLGPRSRRGQNPERLTHEDAAAANDALAEQLQELAAALEAECFYIIFQVLPNKARILDDLYKRNAAFTRSSDEVERMGPLPAADKLAQDPKRTHVPSNAAMVELSRALKAEMLELQEYMSSLSIWIQLNVPRMSDNGSFSESVQGELLGVIQGAEGVGFDVLDQFASYHLMRAEMVTKLLKYPAVEDFRHAIIELDEKSYLKSAMVAAQVRSLYLTLFDTLSKNLQSLLEQPDDSATRKMFY